jgi:hypothetical protein
MNGAQARQVAMGLAAVILAALLLDIVVMLLGRAVPHLIFPLDDVVMVLVLIIHLVLMAALFFAIPQTLVLWRAGIASRWPYFLIGALSAAMFLAYNDTMIRLNAAVAHTPSIWAALSACLTTLMNVPLLARDFGAIAQSSVLYWLMAVGAAICGFGWRSVIYLLPGETGRDWESRILAGRPPYSR